MVDDVKGRSEVKEDGGRPGLGGEEGVDDGRVAVGRVAPAEAGLGGVELGPRLALEPQEEEPLEDLPEDADDGDGA